MNTFTCMPFGLSSAPRIFTKVMEPVIASARSEVIRLIIYLDDILIMALSTEESARHTNFVVFLLESLGFIINREKSCLQPQSHLTYLGFEIDTKCMTISVPDLKLKKLQFEGTQIISKEVVTIRQLAKVIGLIVSTFDAFPQGKLHFRELEREKTRALLRNKGKFDEKILVKINIIQEISWWLALSSNDVKSPIKIPSIDMVISTDASKTGWGAVSETDNSFIQGKWSETEQQWHINMLELLAVKKVATDSLRKSHQCSHSDKIRQ